MFGRAMVIASCVASVGLLATGLQGYLGAAEGPPLRLHVLLGMGALLLFVLSHAWVFFYLARATAILEETARDLGRGAVVDPHLAGFRRRVLPPLLAAVASAFAVFVTGPWVHARSAPLALHHALLWVALAFQLWAARAEWRALAASERLARTLRAAP